MPSLGSPGGRPARNKPVRPWPRENPRNIRSAKIALGLFAIGNVLAVLVVRPGLRWVICWFLLGGAVIPMFVMPLIGTTLVAWGLVALWLRGLLHKHWARLFDPPADYVPANHGRPLLGPRPLHPNDKLLMRLRRLAISIVVLELVWFLAAVSIVFVTAEDGQGFWYRICYPEKFRDSAQPKAKLPSSRHPDR